MTQAEALKAFFSRQVRHRIALESYTNGVVADILRFIRQMETDTLKRVAVLQATGADLTRGERLQLETLENFLRELRLVYAEGYSKLREDAQSKFDDLSKVEAEFQSGSLARALDDLASVASGTVKRVAAAAVVQTPTVTQLATVMDSHPIQGRLISTWFDDLEADQVDRIETQLRMSFVEGETVAQTRARMAGVWDMNARGAEAVIRTVMTGISANVAQASYEANPDTINQVEWVSVLDSRTTPFCQAHDGKKYPLDSGPRPPAHIRCRSTIVPIILDLDPPERQTYGEWLEDQDAETQDDILGPTRGELFRNGGLDVQQFVARDGQTLTLDELRQRNPEAFARAGVPGG